MKEEDSRYSSSLKMEGCDCIEPQWHANELLVKYQYISNFFIALAYFSIPLELIYFVKKSSFFLYRWVLIQFGAFIVLCGATHLINLWTFTMHSRMLAIVMIVAKVSTVAMPYPITLMLVPDMLSIKTRELFLKTKLKNLIERGILYAHRKKQWMAWKVIDESMGAEYLSNEAFKCIEIGLLCLHENHRDRLEMASLVATLGSLSVGQSNQSMLLFCNSNLNA